MYEGPCDGAITRSWSPTVCACARVRVCVCVLKWDSISLTYDGLGRRHSTKKCYLLQSNRLKCASSIYYVTLANTRNKRVFNDARKTLSLIIPLYHVLLLPKHDNGSVFKRILPSLILFIKSPLHIPHIWNGTYEKVTLSVTQDEWEVPVLSEVRYRLGLEVTEWMGTRLFVLEVRQSGHSWEVTGWTWPFTHMY